jgi:nitroreductase
MPVGRRRDAERAALGDRPAEQVEQRVVDGRVPDAGGREEKLYAVDNADMAESFYDLLKKRRAVRSYTGEPVPRETLERIARAARRGPNAGYSQGLRLLVVDDPETIAAFTDSEADEREQAWFLKAAAHFFVLTREQDYHDRYTQPDKLAATGGVEVVWPVPFWHVDAGAALMLLWLAAIDEGLGAGVYGVPVEEDARMCEVLGIPDDLTIVTGVTVGHPAEDPDWDKASSVFSQRRRAHDEVVRWNRWGS